MHFLNISSKPNWILLFLSLHHVLSISLPLSLQFLPILLFPLLYPSQFHFPFLDQPLFVGIAIYQVKLNVSVPPYKKTSFTWPVFWALSSPSNHLSLDILSPFDCFPCVPWFFPYPCLHWYWGCPLSNFLIYSPLSQPFHWYPLCLSLVNWYFP